MRSQKKFTKAMVIVVSLTGLFSTALLLNDPPANSEKDITPAIFDLNSARIKAFSDRGLASVDEDSTPLSPNILEVACGAQDLIFDTSYSRMRLKGENCVSGAAPKTEIKNSTNGYVATVFHKPDFSFTTDYINLSEGKNEIDLIFETADGTASERRVIINRAPAAAVKN